LVLAAHSQEKIMMPDLSFERALAFAQDLIRIPGPSGGEGAVAARVVQELKDLGFDDVWTDTVGNVLARVRGRGEAPPVMLSSHLDVVDVGDPASWEYPPFGAVIADGFLHGRGAMDIKGPLALQTYAAAHFLRERPAGDIIIGHTVYEERAGWGMSHLLATGEVRPGVVILGEATGGDICIGHRGRAELIVEAQGVAGHASAPERARNPLDLLERILPALRELAATLPSDPTLGPSTMAPTAVETLPRSKNVIPDRARITIDWRILPGLTPEEALESVRRFLAPRVPLPEGYAIEVRFAFERQWTYTGEEQDRRLFTHGFLIPTGHPIVGAAARAVSDATGRAPVLRPWTFATDGGQTCGLHGIPTFGYAPGEERYAHTNRERLELESARVVYESYPALIRAVQEAARVEGAPADGA
jgi:putative selenium metabolism hydrolase